MSLLDDVQKEVSALSEEQLRAEFAKIQEANAKRKEKQKEYNQNPENKEKRLAYSKQYREKNPEKFKEQRKAYMQKPEVKERMKGYRTKRNAEIKEIIRRAKELGIVPAGAAEGPSA